MAELAFYVQKQEQLRHEARAELQTCGLSRHLKVAHLLLLVQVWDRQDPELCLLPTRQCLEPALLMPQKVENST